MKAIKIIARIISLPLVVGIVAIHHAILVLIYAYNFLRYGGETISYTKYNNTKTVMEVHDYIRQQIAKQENG